MSRYFTFFPSTKHTNRTAVDITKRASILKDLFSNPYIILPYTIIGEETAEEIAHYYYDDVNKVWLIYYANNIIDPYSQWPLNDRDFHKTLVKKYKDQSGTSVDKDVIAWTKNTNIIDNILYYQNRNDENLRINHETYIHESTIQDEWRAIRVYEYETILNDNKRNIFLVDNKFANRIENELKGLFK